MDPNLEDVKEAFLLLLYVGPDLNDFIDIHTPDFKSLLMLFYIRLTAIIPILHHLLKKHTYWITLFLIKNMLLC